MPGWYPFPKHLQHPDGRLLRTAAELLKHHGHSHVVEEMLRMADSLLAQPKLGDIVFLSIPSKGQFTKYGAGATERWYASDELLKFVAKLQLRHPNTTFISPSLTQYQTLPYMEGVEPKYEDWKLQCETALSVCHKMLLATFTGWEQSSGCKGERDAADKLHIPVELIDPYEYITQ